MARRPIIGVIGGNGVVDPIAMAAKRVGRAIAAAGAVLLTGGQPMPGQDVKKAAMCGAVYAVEERTVNFACFVGILPKDETPEFSVQKETQRLINSRLSSAGRNPVNGMTPDAVLVFQGGPGTLAELGFALAAEKHVLFVDAVDGLVAALKFNSSKFREILLAGLEAYPSALGRCAASVEIESMVGSHLKNARDTTSLPTNGDWPNYDDDAWAQSVVKCALQRIPQTTLERPADYPGIEGFTREEFRAWHHALP